MVTYLVCLVVGDFVSLSGATDRGTSVVMYAEQGKEDYLQFPLDESIAALEFFEEYFGVNYPLSTLQSVSVPVFVYDAMENYGLCIYHETYMLGKASNSMEHKMLASLIIFHEIAHQWVGNLVTPDWWDSLWLSEGFATYLSYLGLKNKHADWEYDTAWLTDVRFFAMSWQQSTHTHSIFSPVNSESDINILFGTVAYEVSGSVVEMLVNQIGETDFKQAMNEWFTSYAGQSVSTDKFPELLDEVTGKDVTGWLNSWLYQPNFPLVTVAPPAGGGSSYTLTQSVYSYGPDPAGSTFTRVPWHIPISLTGRADIIDLQTTTAAISPAPPEDWFVLNAAKQGFYRTLYDNASLAKILSHAAEIPRVSRTILLEDYFNFARTGTGGVDWPAVVDLLETVAAAAPTDHLLGRTVDILFWELAGIFPDAENIYDFGIHLLTRILDGIGTTATSGESVFTTVLRSWIEHDMALYLDTGSYAEDAIANFDAFRETGAVPADLDPSRVLTMIRCGTLYSDGFEFTKSLIDPTKDPEVHLYAALSLGFVEAEDMSKVWAVFEASTVIDKFLIIRGISESPTCEPDTIWNYFTTHFDTISTQLGPMMFTMSYMMGQMFGTLSTTAQADAVQLFFNTNPMPGRENDIAQGIELIRQRASMKAAAEQAVNDRLAQILTPACTDGAAATQTCTCGSATCSAGETCTVLSNTCALTSNGTLSVKPPFLQMVLMIGLLIIWMVW